MAHPIAKTCTAIALVAMAAACNTNEANPTGTAVVLGAVQDETGNPISNATVTMAGSARSVTSGTNGEFRLGGLSGDVAVVQVHAESYAPSYRRIEIFPDVTSYVVIYLREVSKLERLTLTEAQPASVSIGDETGGATLTIPNDSLVDSEGNPVEGEIEAALTYWRPDSDLSTAPGQLLASDPDGTIPTTGPQKLITSGMVEIELFQDGGQLQVAGGASIELAIITPEEIRSAIAEQNDEPVVPPDLADTLEGIPASLLPRLYWLNPDTGLWQEQVDTYTYDIESGILSANLRHLSAYNSDSPNPTVGGCVRGRIVSTCGGPLAGAEVRLKGQGPYSWDVATNADSPAWTRTDGEFCTMLDNSGHMLVDVEAYGWTWTRKPDGTSVREQVLLGMTTKRATVRACSTCGGACPETNLGQYVALCSDGAATRLDVTCQCLNDQDCGVDEGCGFANGDGDMHAGVCTACADVGDILVNGIYRQPGEQCETDGSTCCADDEDGNSYVCDDGICVPMQEPAQ